MELALTRRSFAKVAAGTGALAAVGQLGRTAAVATPVSGYKAMVGIFLVGGNDGWNMVVPTDSRYATYAAARGAQIALPASSLLPLGGTPFALNSALSALMPIWNAGAMNLVLNTGTLYRPITRAQFLASPELRPVNLMSHSDEQEHWQGLRARERSSDGFLGRIQDRTAQASLPSNMSFAGQNLISLGQTSVPLIMGSTGTVTQLGSAAGSADPTLFARGTAMTAMADTSFSGTMTSVAAGQISTAYTQNAAANAILGSTSSTVAKYFVDANGNPLVTDIAQQLLRVARMIEARSTLGQARQTFFVNHALYDTHVNQIQGQAKLFMELGPAVAAFYNAMVGLGLSENVTTFTMSDFGRVLKGNGSAGADHAWGNNHFVIGGALKPKTVHGTYPSLVMGGPDDAGIDGRFIPTLAQEEYLGAIAQWHGVSSSDMSYVFPNWATWSTNGRGPVSMFKA